MKNLYCLISDGGDGSYCTHFTFNKEFIDHLESKSDEAEHGDLGVDGDGFHYRTLTVPDECTLENLGILDDAAVDFAEETV
jgi:hypothetical protein